MLPTKAYHTYSAFWSGLRALFWVGGVLCAEPSSALHGPDHYTLPICAHVSTLVCTRWRVAVVTEMSQFSRYNNLLIKS